MCDDVIERENAALDRILAERRSHRVFRPEFPADDDIRRILHAGLLAPFAAAAVGTSKDYFRRFFILKHGSAGLNAAAPVVFAELNRMADGLEHAMEKDPDLRAKALPFSRRMAQFRQAGIVPGVGTAPFYIVAAERKGFPPVQAQSLSHCMQNMWLKATALGLGFHLVSITAQLSANAEFCKILGIAPGEWELMGCAVGYSEDELSPSIRPPVDDVSRWLD